VSVGWVDLIVDGKPAIVRICYVRAWDDPEWRRVNDLPPKKRGGARRKPKETK
jgi:hypothetical protein